MLCINIAYVYLITVGSECAKKWKNKEFGAFVKTKRANNMAIFYQFYVLTSGSKPWPRVRARLLIKLAFIC